jgi:hypothetical protein
MQPDTYQIRNPSRPTTALAAWCSLAQIGRNALASQARLSEGAVSSALKGDGGTRHGTALALSVATGLPAAVIEAAELRSEWTFHLGTDGTIKVDGGES